MPAERNINLEKFNKGKEDARKRYPPREEDSDYVEGYAEEYAKIMKEWSTGRAR